MSSEFIARATYNTDHSSVFRFVWSHIRRHRLALLGIIFGAFSNAALASAVPLFIGRAFDAMIERQDVQYVGLMAIAIIISQVLRGALQLIRNYSAETFAQRIERDVRDELYGTLLGKSMTYHDFQPVG